MPVVLYSLDITITIVITVVVVVVVIVVVFNVVATDVVFVFVHAVVTRWHDTG